MQKIAYFKIIGSKYEVYEVRIKIEQGEAIYEGNSCTCKYGSFYSQTKKNKEQNAHCKHIDEALYLLKNECWIN